MGGKFRILIVIEPGEDPRFPKMRVYTEPIEKKSEIYSYEALAKVISIMKKMENERGEVNERDLKKALGKKIGPHKVQDLLSELVREGIIFRPRKGILEWT